MKTLAPPLRGFGFYRTIGPEAEGPGRPAERRVRVLAVSEVTPEPAIRLYPLHILSATRVPRWALQVRGMEELKSGLPGKRFYVAMADLGLDDLKALRDAVDAAIQELKHHCTTCNDQGGECQDCGRI